MKCRGLWGPLFEDDKDFKHLQVLVVPVADDPEVPGKMRQVACVRSGATVFVCVQVGAARAWPADRHVSAACDDFQHEWPQ